MENKHYTVKEFWKLYSEDAEQVVYEGEMLEHLADCALCKMKMKAATMFALLEDDEVLALTMNALIAANKAKALDEAKDKDEDRTEDDDEDDDDDEDLDW